MTATFVIAISATPRGWPRACTGCGCVLVSVQGVELGSGAPGLSSAGGLSSRVLRVRDRAGVHVLASMPVRAHVCVRVSE